MSQVPPSLTPNWAGRFHTFDKWVSGAERHLTGVVDSNGRPLSAMCVDSLGRRCCNGRDFMRARDEGTFPVWFFWDCETEDALQSASDTREGSVGEAEAIPTEPNQKA